MIILMPCYDKPRDEAIQALKAILKDCKIFISTGGNSDGLSFDKVIKHENNGGFPLERVMHYYNKILTGFIPLLKDFDDSEPILLIHDHVIINETAKLLFSDDLEKNIFISARIRKAGILEDRGDRCIAFTKKNFIMCHSFSNTKETFNGLTTVDFISNELDKLNLKYKWNDNVTVKEINSFWN